METENNIPPQTSEVKEAAPTPTAERPKKSFSKLIIITLLVIIMLLIAVIAYFALTQNTTPESMNLTPTPTQVTQTISPSPSISITASPSSTINQIVQGAIDNKDYASLEPYMADTMTVTLYASECCGPQTKAQAMAQFNYLATAQGPWIWDQNNATIQQIKAAQPTTFGKGTIGYSSNEYTLSYEVANNKITALHFSASYKLLLP